MSENYLCLHGLPIKPLDLPTAPVKVIDSRGRLWSCYLLSLIQLAKYGVLAKDDSSPTLLAAIIRGYTASDLSGKLGAIG